MKYYQKKNNIFENMKNFSEIVNFLIAILFIANLFHLFDNKQTLNDISEDLETIRKEIDEDDEECT